MDCDDFYSGFYLYIGQATDIFLNLSVIFELFSSSFQLPFSMLVIKKEP